MTEVNYYLRDGKADKETNVILYFSTTKRRMKICSVDKINPGLWDARKQRAKQSKAFPTFPEFNRQLDKKRELALDAYRTYLNENDQREPSDERLKEIIKSAIKPNELKDSKIKPLDFQGFVELFIEECETGKRLSEKGTPITKGTITIYKTYLKNLIEFKALKRYDLSLENIGAKFFEDFKDFLMFKKAYATNTLAKHIRTTKLIVNEAVDRGLTSVIFTGKRYRAKTEATETIYLNKVELQRIQDLDLSNNSKLERVRDLFLVGCWTGLRFSDFSKIDQKNFVDGNIEIEMQKTRKKIVAPIHRIVTEIMTKYNGITENSLPPSISNQKMNTYLKEICEMAGLDELCSLRFTKAGKEISKSVPKYQIVSTHTARRSFATNAYLNNAPTVTIMAVTGHSTESSFMKYIRVTPKEHAEKLKKLWEEQI